MPVYERSDPSRAKWLMLPACAMKRVEDFACEADVSKQIHSRLEGYLDAVDDCLGHDTSTLLRAYATLCKNAIEPRDTEEEEEAADV